MAWLTCVFTLVGWSVYEWSVFRFICVIKLKSWCSQGFTLYQLMGLLNLLISPPQSIPGKNNPTTSITATEMAAAVPLNILQWTIYTRMYYNTRALLNDYPLVAPASWVFCKTSLSPSGHSMLECMCNICWTCWCNTWAGNQYNPTNNITFNS